MSDYKRISDSSRRHHHWDHDHDRNITLVTTMMMTWVDLDGD